jgi:hypothetical protein
LAGHTAHDLAGLAAAIARKGAPDRFDFTYPGSPVDIDARHPYDDHVVLGGIGVLRRLPADVDAVVSLCRLADSDMRRDMPHVEVRLIDRPEADENPHLDFVLSETVRAVEELRAKDAPCCALRRRVQPTPTIAALYGRLRGVGGNRRWRRTGDASPGAHPDLHSARLRRLQPQPRVLDRPLQGVTP